MGWGLWGEVYPVKLFSQKEFFELNEKDLAVSRFLAYSLAMSNTATDHQFAIFQGQQVMILEIMNTTAWIVFKDGDEKEVSMFDLEIL